MTTTEPCRIPNCPAPHDDVQIVESWKLGPIPLCAGHRDAIRRFVDGLFPACLEKAVEMTKKEAA